MTKVVYYRGFIDSCNYACSYCPFAKKGHSEERLKQDQVALEKLYQLLKGSEEAVNLMITPYGEAFRWEFYQRAMAKFSALPQVLQVGIQTNFSLDLDSMRACVREADGRLDKFRIWATYHPECAELEAFAKKVNKASKELSISVGMVASGENGEVIQRMRRALDSDIYLWINAMDRRKRNFSAEKIAKLRRVDPFFSYEFAPCREALAGFDCCHSSDNLYVDAGIYSSHCFFQKKRAVPADCEDHRRCDCYLGYSNFSNEKMLHFFGSGLPFRIPEKRRFKAVFLDLDGILTDAEGKKRKDLKSLLQALRQKVVLCLATARSRDSARKRLGADFALFEGGVFSDGAFIVDQAYSRERSIPMNEEAVRTVLEKLSLRFGELGKFFWQERDARGTLRLSMPTGMGREVENEEWKKRIYGGKTYLQDREASKRAGILQWMRWRGWTEEEVLIVSDNMQDEELFAAFPHTVSPLEAEKLETLSSYTLDLAQLLLILK